MHKIINRSLNGKVFKCSCCNKMYIEFNNMMFTFHETEFQSFVDYIISVDPEKWEKENRKSPLDRKIAISVSHRSILFILNRNELEELKELLNPRMGKTNNYLNKLYANICVN